MKWKTKIGIAGIVWLIVAVAVVGQKISFQWGTDVVPSTPAFRRVGWVLDVMRLNASQAVDRTYAFTFFATSLEEADLESYPYLKATISVRVTSDLPVYVETVQKTYPPTLDLLHGKSDFLITESDTAPRLKITRSSNITFATIMNYPMRFVNPNKLVSAHVDVLGTVYLEGYADPPDSLIEVPNIVTIYLIQVYLAITVVAIVGLIRVQQTERARG